MENFTYFNPTRLVFGRDVESTVGEYARQIVGHSGVVGLVMGSGSVKANGLYDRVKESLAKAGMEVKELSGIRPNPTVDRVYEGITSFKEAGVEVILALGGGSVMDVAKAVAAGMTYEGDVWDFYEGKAEPQSAIPVIALPTQPATGSEQSIRSVITQGTTKTGMGNEHIRPKVAIINPSLYQSLPKEQIAAALVDMMSHIMERYFSPSTATNYIDWQAEAALRCAMRYGPKVYEDPSDFDSWCQIAMVGTFAHNGYFGLGRVEDWACHAIEHELSGWRPEIVHGAGLAVVIPAWMQYVSEKHPERFVRFAIRVMGVQPQEGDADTIRLGIAKLCGFFLNLGLPLTLAELGAEDCPVEVLAAHCCRKGTVGHLQPLEASDVVAILTTASGS